MEQREFPEDVIFSHILPRLPVKAVGKFTLVKKRCKKNRVECGQLFTEGPIGYNSISTVKAVNFLKEESKFAVFGSCNGLLCVTPEHDRRYGRKLYLWNPVIQKFRTVSDSTWFNISGFISVVLGCWYSFEENDFKVMRVMDILERSQAEVYSLSTGLWSKIGNISVNWFILHSRGGVFVDDCVNWLGFCPDNNMRLVVSFDTKTDVFKTSELPFLDLDSLFLMDYKGSLAIFDGVDNHCILWVQRKTDNTSYWVKLCDVVSTERLYRPVGTSINFDILLVMNNFYLVAYDIKNKRLKNIDIPVYLRDFSYCVRYRESLLLLDD